MPKTTAPKWLEQFDLHLYDDQSQLLEVTVWDNDPRKDEILGRCTINLSELDRETTHRIKKNLEEGSGSVLLLLTITGTTNSETISDLAAYQQQQVENEREEEYRSRRYSILRTWHNVKDVGHLTVKVFKAQGLAAADLGGKSDPFCVLELVNARLQTQTEYKTLSPNWHKIFTLCTINLSELDRETTHRIKKNLEEGSGSVLLLLTITGTTNSETISDLAAYQQQQVENEREEEYRSRRYSILRTWHNVKDVGHLTVKVFKAQGLAAADEPPFSLGKTHDLDHLRNVKDIHSVLEVTVYDEDRDNKVDFLGKVSIPLLRIQNGEKKWYALKDKKLRRRAKGTNPQILLEMTIIFNPIRASIRTFDPAEEKYMATEPKFKREIFVRNVMRLKNMVMTFVNMSKTVSSWLEWESPPRSIAAFGCFMVATYTFELYMVPIVFLAFFAKNYLMICMANDRGIGTQWDEIDDAEEEDEFVGMAEEADEEKKTWKEKLQAIQEVTQTVQNVMGNIASLWERTLHVFNFTIPFLSWLAIFLLCLVALVLYVVPLRAMIFIWGVLKFTKKLVRPHALNNNEILDFIWRLPDGEQLVEYRELKLIPRVDSDKRKDNKKSHRKPNT
ncbi:unnamed protein product [Notodromas monacha]|uniref:C2 domain-containing protein n=1 Tax=Notodromas monacha TaxID=399045 RepID=A0A7R9GJB6_9CRUS|nr:unnamed protein product [Notodromas monacha]CAG0923484.1 unnamed protein product [Notodromas monacha]